VRATSTSTIRGGRLSFFLHDQGSTALASSRREESADNCKTEGCQAQWAEGVALTLVDGLADSSMQGWHGHALPSSHTTSAGSERNNHDKQTKATSMASFWCQQQLWWASTTQ
jgi:hypothetical protein